MPEEEELTDQSTIKSSQEEEIPINKSKAMRKHRLQDEAEYEFTWEGHDEQEDKPTLAELKHFIKYAEEIKDFDAKATTSSIETLEASRPTSIWSTSSDQYLQPPSTAWNEAYIMLVSCIDYALDMTCIQSVSQCFIVGGIL